MSADWPVAEAKEPVLKSGTPCWVELATPDESVACAFYSDLFGWTYRAQADPATGRYTVASSGGVATGGIYQAQPGDAYGWCVQLAVHNTAATAEWIEHLGGKVTLGPVDIPGRGSIMHAVEPSGGPVVFWEMAQGWEFGSGSQGRFAGADLNTHDGPAADGFFCRLFDYTSQQIGEQGIDYAEWRLDYDPVLYRYVMGPEYGPDTPPHWMVYFEVDPVTGTDAVANRAAMLGGRIVSVPIDTSFGRIAVLADPSGVPFSIIDHSRTTADWGRAEVDDPYDD